MVINLSDNCSNFLTNSYSCKHTSDQPLDQTKFIVICSDFSSDINADSISLLITTRPQCKVCA